MSDRLAISATLSILMMSIYVLFGAHAARAPLGPDQFQTTSAIPASGLFGSPEVELHFSN